jgi:aryl-alcohol dehydrogenase-like predicted oxidoreductase
MNKDTKIEKSDFRSMLPRFTPEAMEANQALVDLLKPIAERKKATPAQIALIWPLAWPWVVPIPGTTKLHRLEENIRAPNVQPTANDLAEIERAASAITGTAHDVHWRVRDRLKLSLRQLCEAGERLTLAKFFPMIP